MKSGWVKIYRKIDEHWTWKDKPFSKGQAWIDLLIMANHNDGTLPMGNDVVEIKRGSLLTSILALSGKWGWSRKKISGFLNVLEREGQIAQKRTTKYTAITIENYDLYQDREQQKEQQENIKGTSKEHQRNTNKKNKNKENEKKEIIINNNLSDAIDEFAKYRAKIKKPLTDHARKLLITNLDKMASDDETKIAIINQSILNGWQGVFPLKEETVKKQQSSNLFKELMKEEGLI